MHNNSSRQLKILVIENSIYTTGAFKSAITLVQMLKKEHVVEMLMPKNSTLKSEVISNNIVCHTLCTKELNKNWKNILTYLPRLIINGVSLRVFLYIKRFDIVIINDYYNMLGVIVKILFWSGRLITFIRLVPNKQNAILNKIWTLLATMFSNKVVAVSEVVKKQLPQKTNVMLVYCPHQICEQWPDQSKPSDDTVLFLYLSNYIYGKGHGSALKAFARAHQQDTRLRIKFVGGDMGLDKNLLLKMQLIDESNMLGLNEIVVFDNFSHNIERDIKTSDVVLNFSESESFSQTCLEALWYGKPVIATRCGGPEEIIEDGVSGILVPVGDINGMSKAMCKLAKQPLLRVRMGQAGRELVKAKFNENYLKDKLKMLIK